MAKEGHHPWKNETSFLGDRLCRKYSLIIVCQSAPSVKGRKAAAVPGLRPGLFSRPQAPLQAAAPGRLFLKPVRIPKTRFCLEDPEGEAFFPAKESARADTAQTLLIRVSPPKPISRRGLCTGCLFAKCLRSVVVDHFDQLGKVRPDVAHGELGV